MFISISFRDYCANCDREFVKTGCKTWHWIFESRKMILSRDNLLNEFIERGTRFNRVKAKQFSRNSFFLRDKRVEARYGRLEKREGSICSWKLRRGGVVPSSGFPGRVIKAWPWKGGKQKQGGYKNVSEVRSHNGGMRSHGRLLLDKSKQCQPENTARKGRKMEDEKRKAEVDSGVRGWKMKKTKQRE